MLSCRYRLNRRPAQLESFLETWGYLAVFVLSFISSMGLPVGAEVAIIYGGVLASSTFPTIPITSIWFLSLWWRFWPRCWGRWPAI